MLYQSGSPCSTLKLAQTRGKLLSPHSRVSSHQDFPDQFSCINLPVSLKYGSFTSAKSHAGLPSRHHLGFIDNWAWPKSCITLFCIRSFPPIVSFPKHTSRAQGDKPAGLLVTCKPHTKEFEEAGLQDTSAGSHPKSEPTPLLLKTLPSWWPRWHSQEHSLVFSSVVREVSRSAVSRPCFPHHTDTPSKHQVQRYTESTTHKAVPQAKHTLTHKGLVI